jgi:hypothetical protein
MRNEIDVLRAKKDRLERELRQAEDLALRRLNESIFLRKDLATAQERIEELERLLASSTSELHRSFGREGEAKAELQRREQRKSPQGFDRRPGAQLAWDLLRGQVKQADKAADALSRRRDEALEEAAKMCETMQSEKNKKFMGEWKTLGSDEIQGDRFAAEIRALKKAAPQDRETQGPSGATPAESAAVPSAEAVKLANKIIGSGGQFTDEFVSALTALVLAREILRLSAAQGGGEAMTPEEMCPNCVTPWKCNGPHIPNEPN